MYFSNFDLLLIWHVSWIFLDQIYLFSAFVPPPLRHPPRQTPPDKFMLQLFAPLLQAPESLKTAMDGLVPLPASK
jgi:hypothetical protein